MLTFRNLYIITSICHWLYNIYIVFLSDDGRQIIDLLKKNGWALDRVAGSHHIMVKDGFPSMSVPVHGSKGLKPGTLHAILRDAGIK